MSQAAANRTDLDSFNRLLDEFSRLPRKQRPKTLLEIAKFPHSEIACSNILAFFLDPNEEHGLGPLCLNALLAAAGVSRQYEFRETSVEREVGTDAQKRLDIVATAEGECVVGIENKLAHSAEHNPYSSYSQKLDALAEDHSVPPESVVKILLSLRQESANGKAGFKPVTYRSFFKIMEQNLGPQIARAEPRFAGYLIDFLNTITTLEKGTRMDEATLRFFQRQGKAAVEFWHKAMDVCDELDDRRDRAYSALGPWAATANVKKVRFDSERRKEPSERDTMFCSWMWCEPLEVSDDLHIGLEADLYLKEGNDAWSIYFWSKEDSPSRLHQWLADNGIQPLKDRNGKFSNDGWIYATYPFEESPEVVGEAFRDLIEAIYSKRAQPTQPRRR